MIMIATRMMMMLPMMMTMTYRVMMVTMRIGIRLFLLLSPFCLPVQ